MLAQRHRRTRGRPPRRGSITVWSVMDDDVVGRGARGDAVAPPRAPRAAGLASAARPGPRPTSPRRGRCRRAGRARTCTGSGRRSPSSRTPRSGSDVVAGFSPPVASATAHWIASRAWSFCVETVNSLKSGFSSLLSFQKQPRTLPSDVAIAGIERPALLELRQRADERRAEVGHDHVDLRVLGDRRRQHLLGHRPDPSSSPRTAARR